MNILFVCKWNRFRSNFAEAIFNTLNKNPKHSARSGGFFPGVPVTKDIISAGKKIVRWKIRDVFGTSVDKRAKALEKIKKKVETLLKQLG